MVGHNITFLPGGARCGAPIGVGGKVRRWGTASTPARMWIAGPGGSGTISAMCDTLTTVDGAELVSVGELRRYGITVPDDVEGDRCLCHLELDAVLEAHTSEWKPDGWHEGFAEVGPDGRTWFEGYDNNKRKGRVTHMRRSDGRTAKTLEQIEAERAATVA